MWSPHWQPLPSSTLATLGQRLEAKNALIVLGFDLSARDELVPWCAAQLEARETARAERFATAALRRRFVVAHGVVRWVLGHLLNQPPNQVRLHIETLGKPRLEEDCGLSFNLSHAGERALLALGTRAVGVDLEYHQEHLDLSLLNAQCLTPREAATLGTKSDEARRALFYATWTRKEAVVKALGTGLTTDLTSFSVPLTSTVAPHAVESPLAIFTGMRVATLAMDHGWSAAVAAPGHDWQVHCWHLACADFLPHSARQP